MSLEKLVKDLETLYRGFGYMPYTMSKFEEYELYLRNKDFLISDRVLTFTDTDGKLMALKPDVTLSIIKNVQNSARSVQKVFYRENVYRPGKSDQGFREIMQIGLECMGQVDDYCVLEVLLLAVKSLRAIGRNCVLDISHMGLMSRLLDSVGLSGTARAEVLEAIAGKNVHELRRICAEAGAPWEALAKITDLCGNPAEVLPKAERIFTNDPEFAQFKRLIEGLIACDCNCVNVDFSVVNDMRYYNGIVFRGFVEGIPTGVLSGGEYDALMAQMKRSGKAIGFALYPDLLERLCAQEQESGADAVLLYPADAELALVAKAVQDLTNQGLTVFAKAGDKLDVPCKECYVLKGNEVKRLERNA